MSISMDNHETRIKALESNKATLEYGGNSNKGYCKIAGVQFCFGVKTVQTETFFKPFPNTCWQVVQTYSDTADGNRNYDSHITSISATGFTSYKNYRHRYIAIGYLITNRLLTYVREVMSYGITK